MLGLHVLGDRVLVALPPDPENIVSASGIVLVRDPDRSYTPTRGIVVQVGEKTRTVDLDDVRAAIAAVIDEHAPAMFDYEQLDNALAALAPAPFDVQVGNCVIFSAGAGDQFEYEGQTYVILREADVYGIVDPKEAA